jgi:hypothetical protein
MRLLIVLITAMLFAQASFACGCARRTSPYDLPPGEAGQILALKLAADRVKSNEEVLRVKVLASTTVGNFTTYKVQVLEALKSNRYEALTRTLTTGPDSCSLSLSVGEEWLLFVNAERLMQCSGHELLSNAAVVPSVSPSDAARMNAVYYKAGAESLRLVRSAVAERRK